VAAALVAKNAGFHVAAVGFRLRNSMSASVSTPAPGGPPAPRAYVVAFATVYLVWGSTYLAIRVAVESMPPFALAAVRFALAGALLMAFLRARGAAWPTRGQWRAAAVSGFFLLLGGNGLVTWAEQTVPSGITALLIGSGPLFVVLVEWAWPGGARPGALTATGMLLGFGGVAWLAAPWETAGADALAPAGVAAILVACVSWAIGSIHGRHVREPAPPFTAAAAQMLAGSVSLALVALVRGEFFAWDLAATTARSWTAFAYLVVVGSLAGYSAFVWLVKHATPARTATYAYVNPVVAVFLGWLLLGEPVGPRTLAASAVILAAVVIVTLAKTRKRGA
jgi:drug/metabolite transporter (DMT)-like permease